MGPGCQFRADIRLGYNILKSNFIVVCPSRPNTCVLYGSVVNEWNQGMHVINGNRTRHSNNTATTIQLKSTAGSMIAPSIAWTKNYKWQINLSNLNYIVTPILCSNTRNRCDWMNTSHSPIWFSPSTTYSTTRQKGRNYELLLGTHRTTLLETLQQSTAPVQPLLSICALCSGTPRWWITRLPHVDTRVWHTLDIATTCVSYMLGHCDSHMLSLESQHVFRTCLKRYSWGS